MVRPMRRERLPHETDMGVRGIAPMKSEAFEQATLAIIAAVTDHSTVDVRETIE